MSNVDGTLHGWRLMSLQTAPSDAGPAAVPDPFQVERADATAGLVMKVAPKDSVGNAKDWRAWLQRYDSRLMDIFGNCSPSSARRIHIVLPPDADGNVLLGIAKDLESTSFQIGSLQTAVTAWVVWREGQPTSEPDEAVLNGLADAFISRAAQADASTARSPQPVRLSFPATLTPGSPLGSPTPLARTVIHGLATHGFSIQLSPTDLLRGAQPESIIAAVDELLRLSIAHPGAVQIAAPCSIPDAAGTADLWIDDDVLHGLFEPGSWAINPWEYLRNEWSIRLHAAREAHSRIRGERLLREIDDRTRRHAFQCIADARRTADAGDGSPPECPSNERALEHALAVLGPTPRWGPAFKRYVAHAPPNLVVVPQWGSEPPPHRSEPTRFPVTEIQQTLERGIDLLLATNRPTVQLTIRGRLLEADWQRVHEAIGYGRRNALVRRRTLNVLIESPLASFSPRHVALLDGQATISIPIFLPDASRNTEVALDGTLAAIQTTFSREENPEIILRVSPLGTEALAKTWSKAVAYGVRSLRVEFNPALVWTAKDQQDFATALHDIAGQLRARTDGLGPEALQTSSGSFRLDRALTLDWDGTIYGGDAHLNPTKYQQKFVAGHLDDLGSMDRLWMDSPSNEYLLDWTFPPDATRSTLTMNRMVDSFHMWFQSGTMPEAPKTD